MSTTTVNLRPDAVAETRRLTMIRALTAGGDRVSPLFAANGPWIARARTARRRRALDGQVLLVWQIGCADASGRTAATVIAALRVRLEVDSRDCSAPAWLRAFVDRIDSRIPDAIDGELRPLQQALVETCGAHRRARINRERAIAAGLVDSTPRVASYQAGLFDRRSERAHRVCEDRGRDDEHEAHARVLAATSAAAVSPIPPRLILVLAP